MPIPSYPENRREEYLNNIATGSGEIPPYPENREEQYLDAIAKGGGGGSGGVLVVHVDWNTGAVDKTWKEIVDFASTGLVCLVAPDGNSQTYYSVLFESGFSSGDYYVGFGDSNNATYFHASSADDCPIAQ